MTAKRNPAGRAGPNRVPDSIEAPLLDSSNIKARLNEPQRLAVERIGRRYHVSPAHALVVMANSGLGGCHGR